MHRVLFLLALAGAGVTLAHGSQAAEAPAGSDEMLVYFGTYTGEHSKGIYVSRLNAKTGRCTEPVLAAEVKSPSFLAIHPSRKYLYSVNEISDLNGKPTGGVSAFAIDPASGQLTLLNQQPSEGAGPCHLVVDATGQSVLVANYGGGSVAALPIEADGKLKPAASAIQHRGKGANPARQEAPHAHSINLDKNNRFAVAADLGLDQLLIYRFDPAHSTLVANDPPSASVPPGSGPRHFAFHPNGKQAYAINEMLCTVTALDYDAERGTLTPKQTVSTLPRGEELKPEYSTAEVQVHPSGKFLYGSNRGHDTISVFTIDANDGTLRPTQNVSTKGHTPRGFGIDPTGRFLLAGNQDTGTVTVFIIDPMTGHLTASGQTLEVGSPVCVKFVTARN